MDVRRCPMDMADVPMADDPGEAYRQLLAAPPVFEVVGPGATQPGDYWMVGRHHEVDVALHQPLLFSSAKAFEQLGSPLPLVPLAIDPPDHARFRRILDPFFGPKRMQGFQDELRAQVNGLIDGFIDRGECDLVADVAVPYPTQVFLTLFGLPLEDRDRFIAWKDGVLAAADPNREHDDATMMAAAELFMYLNGYVTERRVSGGSDLLSGLLAAEDEERPMDDVEMIGMAFIFVIAGLETVTSSLGLFFNHLARRPDLRRQLVDDPSVIPNAIEELLRVEVPVPTLPRIATEDTEIFPGCPLSAGSEVRINLGAANRDPAVYERPDEIDFARPMTRHLTFGGGIHRCLGSHLARMELRLVLEEWHRRIPEYSLAPGADPKIGWPKDLRFHETMPLVWPR